MRTLALFLLTTGTTLAQSPSLLVSRGDVLPSGAVVDTIQAAEVDSSGRWIAAVRVNNGGSFGESMISSEGFELGEGMPVPGMANATVDSTTRLGRDDLGNSYVTMTANLAAGGFRRVILRNFAAPLWTSDDLLIGPGFGPSARIAIFNHIEVNSGGDILVIGEVNDPNHTPNQYDAIVRLNIQAGTVVSQTLVVDGSIPPAGQTAGVNVFWTLENSVVFGSAGDVLWGASIDGSPLFGAAYREPGQLLGQEGMPSPVPGRTWDSPFIPRLDVNAAGTSLLSGDLDGSIVTDLVYLQDGLPILQEGDSVPGFSNSNYVILGDTGQLSDSGELIHTARISGVPFSQDRMIFAGQDILVREGLSQTSNGLSITQVELSGMQASNNGRWILFRGWVPGNTTASLMLLDRGPEIGSPYCSAEPNSTGGSAVTRAFGSTLVADQDLSLTCEGMPLDVFGFFLASTTQANIAFPGGSQGRLCLGGTIARFNSQVLSSGAAGSFGISVDMSNIPLTPPVAIQAGETWSFQTWFRDENPGVTSNFALPVAVQFQ